MGDENEGFVANLGAFGMKQMRVGLMAALGFLTACTAEEPVAPAASPRLGDSTYEKFLVRAEAGDPDAQNLIGFMLFFGEGITQDKVDAHYWFHRAADQGHGTAQLNLAIMHGLGRDAVYDPVEAEAYYARMASTLPAEQSRVATRAPFDLRYGFAAIQDRVDASQPAGQANYERLCAGCHGLNGIARYVVSPSFAIGERMEYEDERLLDSIANGRGMMPSWKEKLGEQERVDILAYVRTFEARFREGVALTLRDAPAEYFTFGPMQNQPFEDESRPSGVGIPPIE